MHKPTIHPLFVLARVIGVILAILAAAFHAPLIAVLLTGLTGYAAALWALRAHWHPASAPSTPAAPTR